MSQNAWKFPKISVRDLAWLAGLLEGEGCFSLQHYIQVGAGWFALPSIEVKMTDRDVVQRAGYLLGGGQKRIRMIRPQGASKKRSYTWRVNGQRAVYVMSLLLPNMGKRRARRIKQLVGRYEQTKGRTRRPAATVHYRVSKKAHREHRNRYMRRWRRSKRKLKKLKASGG